ncbi:fasciclin domain-containing protein [Candidatus Kaiserbacteria bacterium]|nr:fasciclin domain-containing protein [Candidatus Kaiserbacteria bacterium]
MRPSFKRSWQDMRMPLIWILGGIIILGGLWAYGIQTLGQGTFLGDLGFGIRAATSTASSTISVPSITNASAKKAVPKHVSVVAVVQGLSGVSQFLSLFKSTGVAGELSGKGPYTVLVSTNGAFSQLPPGTISKMTNAQKLRFIQYHVIEGRAIDPQAQTAGTIQSLSGDALNFSFGVDQIPLVNSAIFIEKHQASNGVVYLIDNVLLPPQRL